MFDPIPFWLLHGAGWDEFLLLAGAVVLAFFIVKFTMRGSDGDAPDPEDPHP